MGAIERITRKEVRTLRGSQAPSGTPRAGASSLPGAGRRIGSDQVTISEEAWEALRREADRDEDPEEEREGEPDDTDAPAPDDAP